MESCFTSSSFRCIPFQTFQTADPMALMRNPFRKDLPCSFRYHAEPSLWTAAKNPTQ